jgi:predicted transcriptional regulator of viral defense system
MKTEKFIESLNTSRSSVFSFCDLKKILGKNENYCKIFLNRLKAKGFLIKLEKGKYALPNQNPLIVASNIVFPSYISFSSAYYFYALTTQIPTTIFVVARKQKKEIFYEGSSFKFIKFSRKRFFGYKREILEGKTLFVAEIEKAILDSLFLPQYAPIFQTYSTLKEAKIDKEKLLEYLKKFDSRIVAKRAGYLLELIGIDFYDELKKFLNKNYELLNPLKKKSSLKNEKWKLIINEVLE